MNTGDPVDPLKLAMARQMTRELCDLISEAILAERERCIEAAKAAGNFGDYRRDELTADYGQPRFDMMNEIISAIRNPHSLPDTPPQAADTAGVPPLPAPAGQFITMKHEDIRA